MQSQIVLGAALFSAVTFAQESSLEKAFNDLITSAENAPQLTTAIQALATALPSSEFAAIESDPASFIEQILTETPLPTEIASAFASLPTGVVAYAEGISSIGSALIQSENDAFTSSVYADPQYSSLASVLATAVPSADRSALASNPEAYLYAVAAATTVPSWIAALPTDAVSYLGKLASQEVSIISANTAGVPLPSVFGTAASTGMVMSTAVGSTNATRTSTASTSPITFATAAAPMRPGATGAAALLVGAGILLNI